MGGMVGSEEDFEAETKITSVRVLEKSFRFAWGRKPAAGNQTNILPPEPPFRHSEVPVPFSKSIITEQNEESRNVPHPEMLRYAQNDVEMRFS